MSMNQDFSKQAKKIDTLDAIVGCTAAACMWSGSEMLNYIGIGLNIAELALVKIPFIISYVSQTKDTASLWYWAPKELIANTSPLGSVMDVIPAYVLRVDYTLSK